MSQLGECAHCWALAAYKWLRKSHYFHARCGLDPREAFEFSRASKLDRALPRGTEKKEFNGIGARTGGLLLSNPRHCINIHSRLRNAIKRVIQVVIVTPPVRRGTHFSPPGGTRASLGRARREFSWEPRSLAATERAALVGRSTYGVAAGSWCRGGGWECGARLEVGVWRLGAPGWSGWWSFGERAGV